MGHSWLPAGGLGWSTEGLFRGERRAYIGSRVAEFPRTEMDGICGHLAHFGALARCDGGASLTTMSRYSLNDPSQCCSGGTMRPPEA